MYTKTKLSLVASLLIATQTFAKTENLGTITVSSATKSQQSIKDVTSTVEVISGEELESKQITTVSDALNLVNGINYTQNGSLGSTTSLYLRGMNANRTLILIDGIKLQDPSSTSGANLAHIMIQNIEKIEIIKGAQSGIWGADAVAGVINIITKSPKSGTSGSVNLEAGSFGTKKLGAQVAHKTNRFDVSASAQKIESDGFSSQAPYGEDIDKYEDDPYENTTLNVKSNYKIDDNSKVGVSITKIDALKDYDSFGNPDDSTIKSDVESKLYGVNYEYNLDKHLINVKYERSEFKREEVGTTYGVKNFNGETNNIEINDNFKYNENSFALFGVGSSSDDVDYVQVSSSTGNKKNKDKYIYATNSNKLDNTVLTQSIRHDSYNNFDNKTTGKLGVKHNYSKDIYISSNLGTAYNVPNILQELNPWGSANSDLNPENSKSFDISFAYKTLKTTLFYQKVDDLIEWDTSTSQYKNLDGESKFKGIEFDYKNSVSRNTLLSLNYTILSAKDEDDKYLKRRVKQTLKFGVDYFGFRKLHLNLNGEYLGDRYESDGATGKQTGRYTVANLVATYNVSSSIDTYLKIDNITDKYYQSVNGYATSPRAAYAGVKVNF